MNIGKIYFNFEGLKEQFNLPEDALLKNMVVNNETEEIEITFYTNDNDFSSDTLRRMKII